MEGSFLYGPTTLLWDDEWRCGASLVVVSALLLFLDLLW